MRNLACCAVRLVPICVVRGLLLPVMGIVGVIGTLVYIGSRCETEEK
ncbi:MAG: hypothetical protein HQM08_08730 [Candidatus Riflebacteria bacterium]|nr:hypothetical protein [Candidatus Riflebacteria bacterium]